MRDSSSRPSRTRRLPGKRAGSASHERVVEALTELVRGLDRADRRTNGAHLGNRDRDLEPLLTAAITLVMRVILLAYADAHGLLTIDGRADSQAGELRALAKDGGIGDERPRSFVEAVHARLSDDRRRDVMLADRVTAWPELMAGFQSVHATRGGSLFAPRACEAIGSLEPSDDAIAAMLDRVLDLDGASWADAEVEDIGASYEALVGLELRVARGESAVLLPDHVGVDLEALLATPSEARAETLEAIAGLDARRRTRAKIAEASSIDALRAALARRVSPRWPEPLARGAIYVEPGIERRRAGAHYTPRTLTRPLVERTLAPLLDRSDASILDLRVCDPAMGSGAFLVEACRQLGDRLAETGVRDARARVAERCLHGVDKNPLAVDLARASLWLVAGARDRPLSFVDHALQTGDALIGEGPTDGATRATDPLLREPDRSPLHWREAFADVFARPGGGFDAFIGNPPWVAYAGRAAQPLADDVRDHYLRHYPSFHGYRTLHGLFVYRAASLLRPGGRLGLVVPTSISDLGGYTPVRRAHDALCAIDPELPDFGNAFDGVFQPSMGLLSTRRPAPVEDASGAPWRVARDDLDPAAFALLERLSHLPPLPAACFGERGFQTMGDDAAKLAATREPAPPFVVPIREGADLRAFSALPPRLHLDPSGLGSRLRARDDWHEVAVLVRQTARFPIAALADGLAFRNSILAGFAVDGIDRFALVAWLNAAPIRWLHFMRHRDARQGMPQVKIAHLRTIPRVPSPHAAELSRLGEAFGARNRGVSSAEQHAIDDAVARALALSDEERALVEAWASQNAAP